MEFRGQPLACAGLALALAAVAPAARAADEGTAQTATSGLTAGAPDTAQAVRVVRDKETGKLRAPTDDELRQMRDHERAGRQARGASASGRTAPLAVRQHANGMRSAVLGREYLVTLKAQRGADGKLAVSHDQAGLEHGPASVDTLRPTE